MLETTDSTIHSQSLPIRPIASTRCEHGRDNVYRRCKIARAEIAQAALVARGDGVTLRVRLRPGASRDAVLGRGVLAEGEAAVLIAVSAPPEDGKANAALIRLLAKSWRRPKTSITIAGGATARTKLLHVAGPPDALLKELGAWLDSLPDA
jgi:uncharacterized protein (TIGR00251 family)